MRTPREASNMVANFRRYYRVSMRKQSLGEVPESAARVARKALNNSVYAKIADELRGDL